MLGQKRRSGRRSLTREFPPHATSRKSGDRDRGCPGDRTGGGRSARGPWGQSGLVDVNADALEELAAALRGKDQHAVAVAADVSSGAAVRQMVERVVAAFGTVHILVNNAGVLRNSPVMEMPESEWDLVVDVCLKGAFLCSQAVLPIMVTNRYGKIVNISSLAARSVSVLGGAAYTSAKAGLLGFSRHLAREVAPHGINVNAICPGATDTPMTRMGSVTPDTSTKSARRYRWAVGDCPRTRPTLSCSSSPTLPRSSQGLHSTSTGGSSWSDRSRAGDRTGQAPWGCACEGR